MRLLTILSLAAAAAVGDEPRDARWREDVTTLATELPRRHLNLFFKLSRAEFEKVVDELLLDIATNSDGQMVAGIARLVARVGDAHTSLFLPQSAARLKTLPVRLYWFEEGLYVVAAAKEHERALGARVVRVGDVEPEEALRRIAALISHENEAWLRHRSPDYLVLPELLHAAGIAPSPEWTRIDLTMDGESVFTLDLGPAAGEPLASVPAEPPLYRRLAEENYWFTYLEDTRSLYLRYNRARETLDLPLARFAEQVFEVFDREPVERFIVDLRDNPGGNSSLLPNSIFAGLQQRLPRLGAPTRLYALINRGTFSAALDSAAGIKIAQVSMGLSFIRLYGEPTGGKPSAYGEVDDLVLPNSRLFVSYSQKFFESPFETDSLLPDVRVIVTAADYFSGRDAVLDAALADKID